MPSITTWNRLEPQPAGGDLESGAAARIHDPLWLLARQWQVGEFRAENGGTPVIARWRGQVASLTRYHLGPLPDETQESAARFVGPDLPLVTFVERGPVDLDELRLAVDTGRHFLRMLAAQETSRDYAADFRATYVVPVPHPALDQALDPEMADPATRDYLDLVAGRALDARRLRAALAHTDLPPLDGTSIAPGDRAEVRAACTAWLAWTDELFCTPAATDPSAWQPDRLEYAFSVAGRFGTDLFDEFTLTAEQFSDGELDWHSVDLNGSVNLGTGAADAGQSVTCTAIPAPVTVRGMPSTRFWEFEDAQIDLGALQPGATEIPQLLLIETISGFGNDWFVVPVELPVGSVASSRSLVVTDTFGARTLLKPNSGEDWSMFQVAMPTRDEDPSSVAISNVFFLPPTLIQPIEGPVLEEVLLAQDEQANLAWAVERRLESPIGIGVDTVDPAGAPPPGGPPDLDSAPFYRLASRVPGHWIPLLPVPVDASGAPSPADATDPPAGVRLARSAVLDLDGNPRIVHSRARALGADPQSPLLIPEEEVPREGVLVRRAFRGARWHDGRLLVWSATRKTAGSGDDSAGLTFDTLETPDTP